MPTVADCEFEGNAARGPGGAIATEIVSGITIRRCVIAGNESGTGGGICLTTGPGTIEDCTITGNTSPFGGGIVVMSAWDVLIARCEVASNVAGESGGGIYVSDSSLTVSACEISGNGTGIYVQGAPSEPVHAARNWWGSASGPRHPALNPDGLGDEVSDNVEFEPWNLTAGTGSLPPGVAFRGVSPNPFASSTAIEFSLDAPSPVSLTVHDASGRLVTTILDGPWGAGTHTATWNGRDARGAEVASGVYFLRLEAAAGPAAARAVVLR
jgi:predicted outer membrane repeat protein